MKIEEVIVVEGKNDSLRLKSFFDCDTIETHGLGLSKETLRYIKEVNERRGVMMATAASDPVSVSMIHLRISHLLCLKIERIMVLDKVK